MASPDQDQDGGYASRKLVLVGSSILLLVGVACLSARFQGIQAVYTTLCSTVSVLVATYCGANTLTRHINNLASKDADPGDDTSK